MNRVKPVPIAITIAGSDSGGGAGIQADLKTFAVLGVHGTVALTSVTAQNTYQVTMVHDLPPEMVYEQIRVVAEDMGIDAGKTGMLSNVDIIRAVVKAVNDFPFPLVVDPVMIAKSGARLLRSEAENVLANELIPLAKLVTPNAPEAERLTGIAVKDLESAKLAAKRIVEDLGCEGAVVKGGHIPGAAVDVLYWRGEYKFYEAGRVEGGCTHGTGCSFSAAIAAELAKNVEVPQAVKRAKEFVTLSIKHGLKVGKGHCPVNPIAWLDIMAQRYSTITRVEEALELLLKHSEIVSEVVPEVGMNLVMSLPATYAESEKDVAGIAGRIVKCAGRLKAVGPVKFGASSHIARLVLNAIKFDPSVRSAINVKPDERLIKRAEELGFFVAFIDRRLEPEEVKRVEGASMAWILNEAYRRTGRIPDVIYDRGDVGKEAMMRILGTDPVEVVEKLLTLLGSGKSSKKD
ncbi:MAG: bifunctional hydroxymethylpyrimidine kinase/phosphomethylpyrimidine kinase [Thermofilaceae archaeon]|nr:bifunctional hydroxymethylpyrimidine kinase/phosphomethylpyrimidine kinase [Thermofilaceae archaeon]MCX8181242.1 bifunctional hydroxymethylpyrimidine kinase/phosphomethylpyrimidine kinase [Thermofilaceae archaeon]MDW8003539.1 bifunctional hydroxymethylpyrimidine kinase/phosphomethylpyrimidine kinase [Thermofilaceae archaeon]